jgi:TIR domain
MEGFASKRVEKGMPFLRPYFEYDAFVSYSHGVRSADGDAPLKDWTLGLISKLETDIRTVDPEFDDLLVWRDERIDRSIHLTDELRAKVTQSGILIIVMSPRYLLSNWCMDELEWFRQQVKDRSRDQGRVFIVRAIPTVESKWPDFLRDERGHALVGFCFHGDDDDLPYGYRGSHADNEAYVRELGTLRGALKKRLRELRTNRERRDQSVHAHALVASGGPKQIYLHARAEYVPVREEVKKVLKDDGIDSVTAISDPGRDLADLTRESRVRIEAAQRCHALALVRADADARFVGDLIDIGMRECERIAIARGAPLPCAVLDRSGEPLPIDISGHQIERFDLGSDDWRGKFRGWLDKSGAQTAAAL